MRHQAILSEEAIDAFIWRDDDIYIDGTLGRGGHSRHVLGRLGSDDRPAAFDEDPAAITEAGTVEDTRLATEHDSFAQIAQYSDACGIERVADALLDLGISSPQVDEGARGFSSRMDGPLDMRMDTTHSITAAQWLAEADECDVARVIWDHGEERFVIQIVKATVTRRGQSGDRGPLDRVSELAVLVAQIVKTREKGQDPATRTF